MKNCVGDSLRGFQVELIVVSDVGADIDDVPQHREQMLANAFDHSTVNERGRRSVPDDQLQSSGASGHLNGEVRILVEEHRGIVRLIAGIEHRQGAAGEQVQELALGCGAGERTNLQLRKKIQRAPRPDLDIDFTRVAVWLDGRFFAR